MIDVLFLVLHIDSYINTAIQDYGIWIYLILFLIIFIETGLVFVPFLPGDSLLFVAGALAAVGSLNALYLFAVLCAAAILGDTLNYWIGHHIGRRDFHKKIMKHVKIDYIKNTQEFYKKHGGKTILIARFIPFIRSFAPFVAGMGVMEYKRFVMYNITGGLLWVGAFVAAGFYFGNLPFVKDNFSFVLILIISASILAGVLEFLYHKKSSKNKKTTKDVADLLNP